MNAQPDIDRARNWLDLVVKAAAVIAIVGYMARRDAEISAASTAIVELRSIATDLARGVAVTTTRIDALQSRLDRLED